MRLGLPRLCACSSSASATASGALYTSGNWAALRSELAAPSSRDTVAALLTPSLVPTRHYQRGLPKLPLPSLQDTTQRYLAAAKPLCTPKQHAATSALMTAFVQGEGRRLHEELRRTDRANPHTSYISSDYFEQTLRERAPLPLRSHRTWLVRPDPEKREMLERAAYWVWASVHFYKLYLDDKLRPEVRYDAGGGGARRRAGYWSEDWFQRTAALLPDYVSATFAYGASLGVVQPLDMSQFDCLFNSTRMPGVVQDEMKPVGLVPHVIVQYRGHQFQITVADGDCVPVSVDELYAQLRDIVHTGVAPPRTDVSVLTALPRTEWNGARTRLLRSATNAKALEAVEESMFVLNLDLDGDGDGGGGGATVDPICCVGATAKSPSLRVGNRWWDKSLSVSVNTRGDVAVSAESSWGDGVVVQRYVDDVYALSRAADSHVLRKDAPAVHRLHQLRWDIPTELATAAQAATRGLNKDRQHLHVAAEVLDIADTPDASVQATVQLAAQLTAFRLVLQQRPASCTQDIDLHRYRRGRTEPLHLSTAESTAFLFSMRGTDRAAQRSSCRAAMRRSRSEMLSICRGSSTVSHMAALRLTAERLLGRVPDLYRDPVFSLVHQPTLRLELTQSSGAYGRGYALNPFGYHLSCSRTGRTLLVQVTAPPPSSTCGATASSAAVAADFALACREVSSLLTAD